MTVGSETVGVDVMLYYNTIQIETHRQTNSPNLSSFPKP